MGWTATIKPIIPNPVFNNTINLDVEYTDGTHSFTKQYNLHAQHFQNVSDVDNLIENELQNLTRFDDVVAKLAPKADTPIEMRAKPTDVIKGVATKAEVDNAVIG